MDFRPSRFSRPRSFLAGVIGIRTDRTQEKWCKLSKSLGIEGDNDAKRKKHSPEQIIAVLRRAEGGNSVSEPCHEVNISKASFYRWQRQYGGMEKSELIELKSLQEESTRLKRLVTDQALDLVVLKEVNTKKW